MAKSKPSQATAAPDNAALLQENEELKTTNAALVEEIERLTAAQPAPAAPVVNACISSETFELDGNLYGFALAKLNLQGKLITAAEVLADEELQRKLVAMKSGMIINK